MRAIPPLLSAIVLTSCATGNRPEGMIPLPNSVRSIRLQLTSEQLGPASALGRTSELSAAIGRNLRSHGYPVYDDDPARGGHAAYTHVMGARVSAPEKRSTPPGLSFTFGSSDPRALDFQKADVVSITCLLGSVEKPNEAVTLKGDFALEVGLGNWLQARRAPASMAFYTDRIGTVCLNLLANLGILKAPTPESATQAPWTPEVRVEVRDKPGSIDDDVLPWVSSPAPTATAEPTPVPVNQVAVPAAAPVPASDDVKTEVRTPQISDRKQVVIHSRGNPVILEFGYERK
ncbi:hypothetical protein EWI61_00980 [Methylolobus aquaticus]|nr:hypothetical protein EWI61_00980 [Methylolobus aquaticus]